MAAQARRRAHVGPNAPRHPRPTHPHSGICAAGCRAQQQPPTSGMMTATTLSVTSSSTPPPCQGSYRPLLNCRGGAQGAKEGGRGWRGEHGLACWKRGGGSVGGHFVALAGGRPCRSPPRGAAPASAQPGARGGAHHYVGGRLDAPPAPLCLRLELAGLHAPGVVAVLNRGGQVERLRPKHVIHFGFGCALGCAGSARGFGTGERVQALSAPPPRAALRAERS